MRRSPALAVVACAAGFLTLGAGQYTIITLPGTPPTPKHAPRPVLDEATKRDLARPPLVAAGPARLAAGPVASGEAFLERPVRHGLTGVLTGELPVKGWFSGGRKLPAGTSLYGVPMAGPDGPTLVWCAPRPEVKKDVSRLRSVCLPFGDKRNVWVEGRPAMMPVDLTWTHGAALETRPPDVRQEAVEFPPLTLSYAFAGLTDKGLVRIAARLDWGEGPQLLREIALAPGADGAVVVRVAGGQVALKAQPGATPADPARVAVELRAPLTTDAPVVY